MIVYLGIALLAATLVLIGYYAAWAWDWQNRRWQHWNNQVIPYRARQYAQARIYTLHQAPAVRYFDDLHDGEAS